MKKTLILFLFSISTILICQEENSNKWQIHAGIGQYPANIIVPKFNPLHLGVTIGATYDYSNHSKSRLLQSGNLGYFYHRGFQRAIQLYTEFSWQLQFRNGLRVNPFAIGGGYVLSISDLTTLEWNETLGVYEVNKFPVRNNWLLSIGASVGYQTNLQLLSRPLSFFLDYRIQVQGIIVRETVPVLAYTPIKIGVSIPISKNTISD